MHNEWRELRNAIIMRAIDDYQMLADSRIRPNSICNYKEIEVFIMSDWCDLLLSEKGVSSRELLDILRDYRRTHEAQKQERAKKTPRLQVGVLHHHNGWNAGSLREFINDHRDMDKTTERFENGYIHKFSDGQTYALIIGDVTQRQPTVVYINGEIVQEHYL